MLIFLALEQEHFIVATIRMLELILAINNVRCIQFRPRVSSDVYYIVIVNGIGCSSYVSSGGACILSPLNTYGMHALTSIILQVGQNTGVTMERTVTLQAPGCFTQGVVMHEFLHTLGM
jgi:hypothetical protein